MYCAKSINDLCKTDKECISKNCLKDGTCGPTREPLETNGLFEYIFTYMLKWYYIYYVMFLLLY